MAMADCCRATVLSIRIVRATAGASCATLGATTVIVVVVVVAAQRASRWFEAQDSLGPETGLTEGAMLFVVFGYKDTAWEGQDLSSETNTAREG